MNKRPYPYVPVERFCLSCNKQIPARAGNFCWKVKCQAAKKARKKANEKAWNAVHKPWNKRNYENSSKEKKVKPKPVKKLRYCQYRYCAQKKVPLPEGFYMYHPHCYSRVCDIEGRGISTDLGI